MPMLTESLPPASAGAGSCKSRGKMRKKDADPLCPLIIKDEDPYIPSKGWAEMIKKVYGG
jgi:hypothetical protein